MVTPTVTLGSLDLDGVDADGVLWTCDPLVGWQGPASTLSVQQKPRGHGGWAGESFRTPRTVGVSGSIVAPTPALLEAALDRLNSATSLTGAVLTVHGASGDRWASVRRSGQVLAPLVTNYHCDYSLSLVAADSRKFGQTLTTSTALPSSSGGLTVPFTVPFTISAVTVSGQVSLSNPGNVAGPVRLRIDGPVTGPVVTHVSSGRALVFASSLVLGAGQWVEVDMEARTVLENGQASRNGWVTSRGWSQFEPGDNTWAFTAMSYDAGALLTVTATESWE